VIAVNGGAERAPYAARLEPAMTASQSPLLSLPRPPSAESRVRELERQLELLEARYAEERQYWSQLEAIIDYVLLAIYLKDSAYGYLLVNREYERLSQVKRANVLGKEDFEVLSRPVAELFRAQDEEVVAKGAPVEFRETIPLPDGVHSFITSKFPLKRPDGTLFGVAGVCTEITALEQARTKLEAAQTDLVKQERLAALGELAAVVAHEVRNPLAVIFNAISALKHTLPPEHRGDELLDVIGEEADRLDRMVSALLEVARPVEAKLTPTGILELVRSAIDAARGAVDPEPEVKLVCPEPLPVAHVDEHKLHQALVNLVSNAAQSPGRHGPVQVRVTVDRSDSACLRFEIIDDGVGVPEEARARLFTPFFTTRARGTGLGLVVVRRVAEAHKGTVRFEPTPGGGATFVLSLPLRVH
jgi:signal transduction histidine kinase